MLFVLLTKRKPDTNINLVFYLFVYFTKMRTEAMLGSNLKKTLIYETYSEHICRACAKGLWHGWHGILCSQLQKNSSHTPPDQTPFVLFFVGAGVPYYPEFHTIRAKVGLIEP